MKRILIIWKFETQFKRRTIATLTKERKLSAQSAEPVGHFFLTIIQQSKPSQALSFCSGTGFSWNCMLFSTSNFPVNASWTLTSL